MTLMPDPDLPLAGEFPAATRDQWLKLVDGVLKGASFDKVLVGHSYDGLRIAPLYGRDAQARPVAGRAPGAAWQVTQRVDHPDPAAANTEALHDLENGATGLALVLAGSVGAYGYGLPSSEAALERALEGVYLDAGAAIDLDLAPFDPAPTLHLAALVKRRGIAPVATAIRFNLDPVGALATSGHAPAPWSEVAKRFAGTVTALSAQGFDGPFALADGRVIHAAGGSEAQELAFVLACAVTYLRLLETAGIAPEDARRMIAFKLVADADAFMTIAKFRALRKLWARVEAACGLTPETAFVSAETAWRMTTKRDPWVNMLRATVAVFSAGLGGADAVTVLPHTMALGLPDRFARRAARNTQLVLLEESNLAKVADPAAGAGGIEALTGELCAAAWRQFQEIEAAGGVVAALERGLIQNNIATVRATREKNVARRKDALTGTSEFPNIAEAPVKVLDVPPMQLVPAGPAAVSVEPLSRVRLAEPFEALRDASDRVLEETGSRPKIFLASLGGPSDFSARATFARNFFEAGGIEAVTGEASAGPGDLAAAFTASGARLACLCSSDKVYETAAAEAARALAASGAAHIYLAGRPKDPGPFTAAGVGTYVFAGCDAPAVLGAAYDMLRA